MISFRQKYNAHKSSAKNRGIEFSLTFDDWLFVWASSGYHLQYGDYCMCRKDDKGGYTEGNVYIKSRARNSLEGSLRNCPTQWTREHDDIVQTCDEDWEHAAELTGRTASACRQRAYRLRVKSKKSKSAFSGRERRLALIRERC